jgi:hypothetical protein
MHNVVGKFAIAEIVICASGTLIAVAIMFLHSKAAYGESVPSWLLMLTGLKKFEKRESKKPSLLNGTITNDGGYERYSDAPAPVQQTREDIKASVCARCKA